MKPKRSKNEIESRGERARESFTAMTFPSKKRTMKTSVKQTVA